jgi:predicted DNA-binding transcriptional regulator YafY
MENMILSNKHIHLLIDYTNYKGERKQYKILPDRIEYTSNEWHPEEQYILYAFDIERTVHRTFALNNIHSMKTISP